MIRDTRESPSQPARFTSLGKRLPANGSTLLLLFLAALLVRLVMATRQTTLCPDAVVYVEAAESMSRGEHATQYGDLARNAYSYVLYALSQTGLADSCELAGRRWGVVVSSLGVLPLFGWTRRRFHYYAALVAGIFYVVHPELVEWGTELIRDPTFWTLTLTSLYFLQSAADAAKPQMAGSDEASDPSRARGSVRGPKPFVVAVFLAAAVAAAVLASLFRIEGLLLVGLASAHLLGNGIRRSSSWARQANPLPFSACRRGIAGLLLGAFLLAGLLGAIHHQASRHGTIGLRTFPLQIARLWWETMSQRGGESEDSGDPALRQHQVVNGVVAESLAVRGTLVMRSVLSAVHPLFAGLIVAGLWTRRRRLRNWLVAGEMIVVAGLVIAIWIHLWFAGQTSARYAMVLLLLGLPWAAVGFLRGNRAVRRRLARGPRSDGAERRKTPQVSWLPAGLALIAVIGLGDAWSTRYASRESRRLLGEYLAAEGQHLSMSELSVLGSRDLERLVGHYGRLKFRTFADPERSAAIGSQIRRYQPDFVLVSTVRDRHPSRQELNEILGQAYVDGEAGDWSQGYPPIWIWRRVRNANRGSPVATPSPHGG